MDKLLKLLDTNARLTNAQLAVMLGDNGGRCGRTDSLSGAGRRYPCL